MKIVFDPVSTKNNRYIDILVQGIKTTGIDVYSLSSFIKNFNLIREIQIIHLNWYENLDTKWDYLKKLTKLYFLIILQKRIIWTFHNRQPHNNTMSRLQSKLQSKLIEKSHAIVIHSKSSRQILIDECGEKVGSKIIYIPHPNYIDCYSRFLSKPQATNTYLNLLFVGAIKPYKNIELLIKAFGKLRGDDIRLTIAGKPITQGYGEKLKNLALENGTLDMINLDFQFLTEEKLLTYIDSCSLLVLPYDLNSSLNSGTILLAFSRKKTVLSPLIGTLQDFESKKDFFSYGYSHESDHLITIVDKIKQIKKLQQQEPSILIEMGEKMFEKVRNNNNNKSVINNLIGLYENC